MTSLSTIIPSSHSSSKSGSKMLVLPKTDKMEGGESGHTVVTEKGKKSSNLPHQQQQTDDLDRWDDSLLTTDLIDEVWREQFSPPHTSSSSSSSGDEPYQFITDSGTAITLFRKKTPRRGGRHGSQDSGEWGDGEEEEPLVTQVPSLPDVEGGVPKSQLKVMKLEEIEMALAELEDSMNFVVAENIIFERTISRMEQRDKEIEAAMPIFTYKYPWEEDQIEDKVEDDDDDSQGSSSDDDQSDDEDCDDDDEEEEEDGENEGEEGEDGEEEEGEENENNDEEQLMGNYLMTGGGGQNWKRKKKRKSKRKKRPNPMIGPDRKIREICDWQDSDDEEYTGTYDPIKPAKEISVSKDKFFEGMPIQDKYAIRMYIRSFGDLAPSNYDYMRHKYGKLVQNSYQVTERVASAKVEENIVDDWRDNQKIFDEVEGLGDEDADFPGFFPRNAKRLPLEYKYKYAEEEDEILAKEIMTEQTKSYRKENAIQVLIDTNIDAFELVSNLNDEFTKVLNNALHPLTKKLMAEKILNFRKIIRSKILAEETKITMSLVELQKVRRKVNEQLKTQQEMGFKLQKIDFEQIRIRNNEYTNRIEKAHTELKGLKLLTAGCFQILKEQRQKLNKKIKLHARMVNDIELRETLMTAFQADLQKYTQILNEVQQRNNFMRKRIRAFKVPNSMEYIRFKAILYGLEEEVASMKKRLRSLELNKGSQQQHLEILAKGLPIGSLKSLNDNEEWMEEMKKQVNENGLLSLLTEDELNNVHPEPKKIRQLGETTTTLKNFLLLPKKKPLASSSASASASAAMRRRGQFVPAPKHVRDIYDPEEDQISTTDVTKMRNNRSKQTRQIFNRLHENKPNTVTKTGDKTTKKTGRDNNNFGGHKKCDNLTYRRGVRGNIVIDESQLKHLIAKC